MSIDIYQQCPACEGKKLKFCCGKNVVQDLNDALSKHQSGQSSAALEKIDRAMESIKSRDCLITYKTFVQIATGDIEGATQSNSDFLSRNPENQTGLEQRAMIEAIRGEVDRAALTLQDTMDAIKGTEIPVSLARVFEMVGLAFVKSQNLSSARAHISFALFLREEDARLSSMLRDLYNPGGAVLFLKADHQLAAPVEDAPWEKAYMNVHRAIGRGQFRRALGMLLNLDQQYPDVPEITKGIAVVTSMFAPTEAQIASWRKVAAMPSTRRHDAIEYYGLAESIAGISQVDDYFIPVNRCTWEVADFAQISESAISSPWLVAMEATPDHDPLDDGPAPRSGFVLMNRPPVESAENLSVADLPLGIGEVLLYGKQTDREARVELLSVENENHAQAISILREQLGLEEDPATVPFDRVNRETDALTWKWELPEDVTPESHGELIKEMKRAALYKWADLPSTFADGKSLREVAKLDEYEAWAQAKMQYVQQTAYGEAFSPEMLDELREEIGLKPLDKLVPDEEEFLTPAQSCLVDASALGDEQLLGYHQLAIMMQNFMALRVLTPEVLKREHLENARRDICHINMARFSETHEEALEHFAKSRAEAGKIGAPIGILLVAEFEYRLRNGLQDKLDSLLATIEARHMKEPGVEEELARLFHSLGIHPGAIPEEAVAATGADSTAAAAVDSGSQAGGSQTESGLWLPD